MTLRCIPGQNMTQEEMERQCRLVSNAAEAMEGFTEQDDYEPVVNLETLEVRMVKHGE